MNWRLKNLPTVEEITLLIKQKVITNDEAREMLFKLETEEERKKESFQEEIKFLRELVEKLSKSKSEIITVVKGVEVPRYQQQPWYPYYAVWCGMDSDAYTLSADATSSIMNTLNFSDIKTF